LRKVVHDPGPRARRGKGVVSRSSITIECADYCQEIAFPVLISWSFRSRVRRGAEKSSDPIERTSDPELGSSFGNVSVDLGGGHLLVAKQFLNGA